MELNYSLKLADNVLKGVEPITCRFIKDVLTSRGGADDKRSVLAITRLMELLGNIQKTAIKTRIRSIEERHCQVLKNIAMLWRNTGHTVFHRSEFMDDASQNDFSIMQYWELIAPTGKGYWRVTKKGLGFVYSVPGHRYVSKSFMQMGGTRGNYQEIKTSEPVTYSDISHDYIHCSEYTKRLIDAIPED